MGNQTKPATNKGEPMIDSVGQFLIIAGGVYLGAYAALQQFARNYLDGEKLPLGYFGPTQALNRICAVLDKGHGKEDGPNG